MRRLGAAALALGAFLVVLTLPAQASAAKREPQVPLEDAERQAALVAQEDRRLIDVRAVTAVAPLRGVAWSKPYRLDTGSGYTLVLTRSNAMYTVADLLVLAPQTFVRQKDGAYLLTENIYLAAGARLKLSNPGGLTIRLISNNQGFVSIVSFGGELSISGTPQSPTEIVSWDPRTSSPDKDVNDGRAYVRAIGGQVTMEYANVRYLGFWSGRTGGLSLTGTDRPFTGDVKGSEHLTKDERHQAKADRVAQQQAPAGSDQAPRAGGVLAMPSGQLVTPDTRFDIPELSYVSGNLSHVTAEGNAYGMFISSAEGITITDCVVEKSLEHGIVMHRFATSAVVNRVTSKLNGGDGFVLSRATSQVRIEGSTSEQNGGNGFTLSGQPLASGPSASGLSVAAYGSNSVSSSLARDNGHYGIEVLGGLDVGVTNNRVEGGDMGIVARQGSERVNITGNQLDKQDRQGIAVRDGVIEAKVTGNVINDADTAIYLRDSVAEVRGNAVHDARNHGISLVGATGGSVVAFNTIAGVGPSALDIARMKGRVEFTDNQTYAWFDTSSFWTRFRSYWSPMTILWTTILVLIVLSGFLGQRRRRRRLSAGRHPYADKAALRSRPPQELGQRALDARNREQDTNMIPVVTA